MMLGTGVGWVEEEARAVGSSFSDRGRRASEYIRAMRALWNEPVASFEGVFVNFSNVVCEPRPIQPGGVPIHIGGHSPAAARRAGRLGDGFYPLGVDPDSLADLLGVMEGAAREAGRDPAAIEITCSGSPRAELACRYRDVGIDRMVVFPPTGDLEKLALFLETFRRDAVEKLA
jgi:alkanesulfonate monooxygenase SsuD/methylene tetrahydromethanopterin reductase-like flavin-dependent oxidoreductase (luciferase family)